MTENRINGNRPSNGTDICCMKECQKTLQNETVYEWNWFIDDRSSQLDGESHHVKLCKDCYEKLDNLFVHHVKQSLEITGHVAYGGNVNDLSEREKERITPDYEKELLAINNK